MQNPKENWVDKIKSQDWRMIEKLVISSKGLFIKKLWLFLALIKNLHVMKKLYFIAAAVLSASMINAQSLSAVSTNENIETILSKPADILYLQDQTTTSGIVSNILNNGTFVMVADDFTLTETSDVKKVSFLGFQNAGTLATLVKGVVMYIYSDDNGKPSGIPASASPYVAKIDLSAPSSAYTITTPATGYSLFTIDLVAALGSAVTLQADTTYWVTFAPKVNLNAYTATTRWNWTVGDVNFSKAKLVDPADAFGAGATNWTNISSLTADVTFDGLAFSLEGDAALKTNELFGTIRELIVTQDADQLYIFTKNEKLKNVEIYATDGRKVLSGSSDKISVAKLSKGIYIVNVTTNTGKTFSTKFMKK